MYSPMSYEPPTNSFKHLSWLFTKHIDLHFRFNLDLHTVRILTCESFIYLVKQGNSFHFAFNSQVWFEISQFIGILSHIFLFIWGIDFLSATTCHLSPLKLAIAKVHWSMIYFHQLNTKGYQFRKKGYQFNRKGYQFNRKGYPLKWQWYQFERKVSVQKKGVSAQN